MIGYYVVASAVVMLFIYFNHNFNTSTLLGKMELETKQAPKDWQPFLSTESTGGNQSDGVFATRSSRKRRRKRTGKKIAPPVPELVYAKEYQKLRLLKSNLNRTSDIYFISEVNYFTDEVRNSEVMTAISLSVEANPQSRMLLVVSTKNETLLENFVYRYLQNISYDIYFCEEVLYGTLLELGNMYPGMKFAGSADDYYPFINFTCSWSFKENNEVNANSIVYALSRLDPATKQTCSSMMVQGSFDGLLFNYVPESVLKNLRFSRSYFGCENVAAAAFMKESFKIYNLCPFYYPVHFHSALTRPGRLRINHVDNSNIPLTFTGGSCVMDYSSDFWSNFKGQIKHMFQNFTFSDDGLNKIRDPRFRNNIANTALSHPRSRFRFDFKEARDQNEALDIALVMRSPHRRSELRKARPNNRLKHFELKGF